MDDQDHRNPHFQRVTLLQNVLYVSLKIDGIGVREPVMGIGNHSFRTTGITAVRPQLSPYVTEGLRRVCRTPFRCFECENRSSCRFEGVDEEHISRPELGYRLF
jgi:hypothetical protein